MSKGKITVEEYGHVLMIGLHRKEKLSAFSLDMYRDIQSRALLPGG